MAITIGYPLATPIDFRQKGSELVVLCKVSVSLEKELLFSIVGWLRVTTVTYWLVLATLYLHFIWVNGRKF